MYGNKKRYKVVACRKVTPLLHINQTPGISLVTLPNQSLPKKNDITD
jgi:hypothetical protein